MPQITAYPSAAAFLPGAASSQMVPLIHPADQALLAAAAAAANGQVNGQTGSGAAASGAATPVSQHAALVQQQQQAAAAIAAASAQHGKPRSDRIEVGLNCTFAGGLIGCRGLS